MTAGLVGRDAELAALDAVLAARGPRSLAVAGEPGIGKTALLGALVQRGAAAGAVVLQGRAAELEREVPFAAWADALDDRVRENRAALGAKLGGEVVRELAVALPGLRPAAHAPVPAELAAERRRLGAAVRALLEALAGTAPLVLVLDDLHWADPASVDVLAALLRRPPAADVLVAVAFRSRQAPARLTAAVDRARRDSGLVHLALGPLSAAEAESVLARALSPELRARVHGDAGGNPFYLEQLARSAQLGGRVPRSVGDAIATELATIPTAARAVLEGAVVTGDPFAPELVAVAAAVPDEAVLVALDALRARDLVRPTPVPRQFALRHPLVREAVYAATDRDWRRAAHRRVAEALRARGEPASVSAHHVARAALPGDGAAIAHLRAAAGEVAGRAPETAAAWLRAALELLAPEAGDAERLAVLEPLSAALAGTGRLSEAREVLEQALAICPPGPAHTALITQLASIEHGLGNHAETRERLLDELEALGRERTADRAALLVELAVNAFYARDPDAMRRRAQDALQLATSSGNRPVAAAAHAAAALAEVIDGRVAQATTRTRTAAGVFDELTDTELAARLDAPHMLTLAEMYVERFEPMVDHARRAIGVARASGQGRFVAALTLAQGFGETMLGRLGDACRHLEAGVESERLNDNAHALSWVLMNLTLALTAAGDLDAALAAGQESVELAAGAEAGIVSAYPGAALAGVLLERGEPDAAVAAVEGGAGGPQLPLIPGFWRVACLDLLVRAELARGRVDAAEAAATTAERAAAVLGQRLARGWARRARAAVQLARGDAAAAAAAATSGAADLRAGRALVEAAAADVLAGRALAAAGEREAAIRVLSGAVAELERFGARRAREGAAQELRRLGQRDAASNAEPLTEREREIAALAGTGATNREIAQRLFLSEKTIEGHLRRAFAKLRVQSRLDLARALAGEAD